jgi:hypothetical protein
MAKTLREDQVHLRIAGSLRAALELEAAECGRSLSNLIRNILVDHAAPRMVSGQTAAAANREQRAHG